MMLAPRTPLGTTRDTIKSTASGKSLQAARAPFNFLLKSERFVCQTIRMHQVYAIANTAPDTAADLTPALPACKPYSDEGLRHLDKRHVDTALLGCAQLVTGLDPQRVSSSHLQSSRRQRSFLSLELQCLPRMDKAQQMPVLRITTPTCCGSPHCLR